MDEKKIKITCRAGSLFKEGKIGVTLEATDGIRFIWFCMDGDKDKTEAPFSSFHTKVTRDEFHFFMAKFHSFFTEGLKLFEELEDVQINDETTQENS